VQSTELQRRAKNNELKRHRREPIDSSRRDGEWPISELHIGREVVWYPMPGEPCEVGQHLVTNAGGIVEQYGVCVTLEVMVEIVIERPWDRGRYSSPGDCGAWLAEVVAIWRSGISAS
jgi:hypothetical protein